MTWAAAHTAFLFLRVQEKEAKEYTQIIDSEPWPALRVPSTYAASRRMDRNSLALRQRSIFFACWQQRSGCGTKGIGREFEPGQTHRSTPTFNLVPTLPRGNAYWISRPPPRPRPPPFPLRSLPPYFIGGIEGGQPFPAAGGLANVT